jgi:starch synthase
MGPGDASYQKHLLQVANELGVQKQFAILPPVGYDEVAQFTASADVGHALYQPTNVNNIHISTASNKIMEYMSASLPLLVSDRPALRSLVEQYRCGATADEANPYSIAGAINDILSDPNSVLRMGAASRQAFETVFCYDRQFAPVIDAINRLSLRS